jgi:hypothetical protein
MPTITASKENAMTACTHSAFRATRYTLAATIIAFITVAGTIWTKGTASPALQMDTARIDVTALTDGATVPGLPILNIEQPF